MIETAEDTFARWGSEARLREPNGVATWWPLEEGGYCYCCTCGWSGASADIEVRSHCMCGAIVNRHKNKNVDTQLTIAPWLVEMRENRGRMEKMRQEYDAMPWWKRMLKKRP